MCPICKCFRFFRYMFLLFSVHQMALGLFRMMASISRDIIISNTFGSAAILVILLLGGFIMPKGLFQLILLCICLYLFLFLLFLLSLRTLILSEMIKPWWVWAFWVSPLSYGQRAISVNEFAAKRWMEVCFFPLSIVNVIESYSQTFLMHAS